MHRSDETPGCHVSSLDGKYPSGCTVYKYMNAYIYIYTYTPPERDATSEDHHVDVKTILHLLDPVSILCEHGCFPSLPIVLSTSGQGRSQSRAKVSWG